MRKPKHKTTRAAEKEPREALIKREGRCEMKQEQEAQAGRSREVTHGRIGRSSP